VAEGGMVTALVDYALDYWLVLFNEKYSISIIFVVYIVEQQNHLFILIKHHY